MRVESRRKQKKRAQNSIKIFLQRIPREKFAALTQEQKYCFLILGHIHDEISWLQRLAYVASGTGTSGTELEQSANMMQATFLARLLLGKLQEVKVLINSQNTLKKFIEMNYAPTDLIRGQSMLGALLERFEQEKWLGIARNKHFLHYPTQNDVAEVLQGDVVLWDEVKVAHGDKSSNTFYPASDVLANTAWFRRVNGGDIMEGLKEALAAAKDLTSQVLDVIEQSLTYFISNNLQPLSVHEVVMIPTTQSIHELKLPYFVQT